MATAGGNVSLSEMRPTALRMGTAGKNVLLIQMSPGTWRTGAVTRKVPFPAGAVGHVTKSQSEPRKEAARKKILFNRQYGAIILVCNSDKRCEAMESLRQTKG
jgi:hypothetical protein